jgi:hypothetical protein
MASKRFQLAGHRACKSWVEVPVAKNAKHSALLVAGAAAAAAAAYIGRRHLSVVKPRVVKPTLVKPPVVEPPSIEPRNDLVARESAELPVGRSADPDIDAFLPPPRLAEDDTSGGMWRGESELPGEMLAETETPPATEVGLDEIWNSLPGFAEGEQTEGYDAVAPEDLGAVWLERATQTTHEERPHASDPNDIPGLDELLVTDPTLPSSRVDEDESAEDDEYEEDERNVDEQ